jgi:hypothetical protein
MTFEQQLKASQQTKSEEQTQKDGRRPVINDLRVSDEAYNKTVAEILINPPQFPVLK